MKHVALALTLTGLSSVAIADCLPIFGTVTLTPDAECSVADVYGKYDSSVVFVGTAEGQDPGEYCFSVDLRLGGILPARGLAGVTLEAGLPPQRIIQGGFERYVLTARSTFKLGRTRFYASEIITQTEDMAIKDDAERLAEAIVTEQSVILDTNDRGLFRNATGYFNILGNTLFGEPGRVTGEICTP